MRTGHAARPAVAITQSARAGADRPVGADRDPVLDEPLADQELEGRPGAATRLEHPVDLPLGQHRLVGAPRGLPVAELRQAAERLCELTALRDRPLESLLPHRHVEAGLPEGRRQRTERVPVERRRRHRPAALLDVVGGRRPAELVAQPPQLPGELLAGGEPARHQPGRAASPRSRCRSARSRSAGAPATADRPRTPSWSASARGAPPTPAAPRGSARPCTAAGSPPGTRRAPADRSPSPRDKASAPPPRMVERIRECASRLVARIDELGLARGRAGLADLGRHDRLEARRRSAGRTGSRPCDAAPRAPRAAGRAGR